MFTCSSFVVFGQKDGYKPCSLSPVVGNLIDSTEKSTFHLFPMITTATFDSAKLYCNDVDSTYQLQVFSKDTIIWKSLNMVEIAYYRRLVNTVDLKNISGSVNKKTRLYVAPFFGYGIPAFKGSITYYTQETTKSITKSALLGSFGNGFSEGLTIGCNLSRLVAIEFSGAYRRSSIYEYSWNQLPDKDNDYYAIEVRDSIYMRYFNVGALLKFTKQLENVALYEKVGVVVGISPEITILSDGFYDGSRIQSKRIYSGGLATGCMVAGGISQTTPSGAVCIFGELALIMQQFSPEKSKLEYFKENDVDRLPIMDKYYRETEYMEEAEQRYPIDYSEPRKSASIIFPMSSFTCTLGLRIRII